MRKVEKQMLDAIRYNTACAMSNTTVIRGDNHLEYPFTHAIYLHGHHIADAWAHADGTIEAVPDRETLEAWPTRTTQSRLWALGIDVSQRDHWVYINDDRICEAR